MTPMEHRDNSDMLRAIDDVIGDPKSIERDPNSIRLELHEKLIANAIALSGQGVLFAFFMSMQAVFLTLQITGDVDWNWLAIPVPTVLLAVTWRLVKWFHRQQAREMINDLKKSIHDIKRHLEENSPS